MESLVTASAIPIDTYFKYLPILGMNNKTDKLADIKIWQSNFMTRAKGRDYGQRQS